MRILFVHDRLSARGGAERYIKETAAALTDKGHEVTFLSAPDERPDWAGRQLHAILPSVGWNSGRKRLADLNRILLSVMPDIIFVHNTKSFLSPILIKTIIRVAPTVLFVHDVRLFCPNETKTIRSTGKLCFKPMGLFCLNGFCYSGDETIIEALRTLAIARWRLSVCKSIGCLIAPSKYIAKELKRNGIPIDRIVVLPHFTHKDSNIPLSLSTTDFLWVGSLYNCKGFEFFIEALGRLSDLPWNATVVREREGIQNDRLIVNRRGLSDRVSFLGYLEDSELDVWYSRARVVVITSLVAESFCLVGIEAMAHGRPVIAFNTGGITEWLQDGSTGIAVSRGNIQAMAAAMRKLLNEPALAESMGEKGKSAVNNKFRLDKHINGLLSAFEAARINWKERNRSKSRRCFNHPLN